MALTDHIDIYCERIGPAFWAEPFNAITNAAFILAAGAAYFLWRQKQPDDLAALALIVVLAAIGVGSFMFHTFATGWAALADVVIPIFLFILGYVFLAFYRYLGLPWWASALGVSAFIAFSFLIGPLAERVVGSSAMYIPAFLAIFAVAGLVFKQDRRLARWLCIAGAIFAMSLTLRTIDEHLCLQLSMGTHFLWHILNSIVLYGLLHVLIIHQNQRSL